MKILLIAPLQEDAENQNWGNPSLGLMRIDSYLKANLDFIETEIYDQQIHDYNPLEKFKDEYIDIIGISLLHYTLVNTLSFIHQWKANHPESLIVVGNNEGAANYQDVFDKSPTDIIVLVEGEQTMVDIVKWKRGLKKLEDINGIIYRKQAKPITNDDLWNYWKYVDFGKYNYPAYWSKTAAMYEKPDYDKVNTVRLVTSSHCNMNCVFCSLARIRDFACGSKVAPASLQGWQIMELVDRIAKQVPDTRTIYFVTDNIFYPNKQYFYDFAELYKQSGYNFRFLAQTASYSVGEKEFELLKSINCQHLTLGIEHPIKEIRNSLGKPQSFQRIENIIRWSKEYNLKVYFLIILLPPAIKYDDLQETYDIINRWMSEGVSISIEPIMYSYRGSPIFEDTRYIPDFITREIKGTGLILRDSTYIWPIEEKANKLAKEFKATEAKFIEQEYAQLGFTHHSKDNTAKLLLKLLKKLIDKYRDQICE